MDDSFPIDFWLTDPFLLEAPISPTRPISAFASYQPSPAVGSGLENNVVASGNVNKRVIEYWRNQWSEKKESSAAAENVEREKCHRHMLNERMRREKERRGYLELHSILPNKTKKDKKSIVEAAGRRIKELKVSEEMVKRRNIELEMEMSGGRMKKRVKEDEKETIPIRVELANPSSGINSMLAVLDVLKTVGIKAKAIQATFSHSHFSAQLAIHTHMKGAKVERALQLTLTEAERKFQRQCQEGSSGIKQSSNLNDNNKGTYKAGPRI